VVARTTLTQELVTKRDICTEGLQAVRNRCKIVADDTTTRHTARTADRRGFLMTATRRAALVMLQLGALAVVLVAVPYKAFELDRFFVPKELALHSAAVVAALLCVWKVQ